MTKIEQEIRDLAQVNGAKVGVRRNGGNLSVVHDTFYDANIVEVPGFDDAQALYPHFRGGRSGNGWRVLKLLEDNIARRDIEVRCAFMAERLIATGDREVLGVCFRDQNGRVIAVKARRALSSHAAASNQTPRRKLSTGKRRRCCQSPRRQIPVTASVWRRISVPRFGTCGTTTAPMASAIPTPTSLVAACQARSSPLLATGRSASPGSIRTHSYFPQVQLAESQTRHEIEIPSSRERTIGLLAPVGGVDIVAAELVMRRRACQREDQLIDSTTAARV